MTCSIELVHAKCETNKKKFRRQAGGENDNNEPAQIKQQCRPTLFIINIFISLLQ